MKYKFNHKLFALLLFILAVSFCSISTSANSKSDVVLYGNEVEEDIHF